MDLVRFLFDENVPPIYRQELLRREPAAEAWSVGMLGAPARGTLDPDILTWCEANGFLLVTNNRKSMPVHLQDHFRGGGHIPGILVVSPKATIGETLTDLILIWLYSRPDEYVDQIIYLPIT